MKKVYVFSTLSTPMAYTKFSTGGNDLPRPERTVSIMGGANVADKNFVTPKGVMTAITEEEYEFLQHNNLFKKHVENGFIVVEKSEHKVDDVVADMVARSPDAPMVPDDYVAEDKAPPATKSAPKKQAQPRKGGKFAAKK